MTDFGFAKFVGGLSLSYKLKLSNNFIYILYEFVSLLFLRKKKKGEKI
jgi:hypothetical protein